MALFLLAASGSCAAQAAAAPLLAVVYVQDLTPSEFGNRIRDILVTRISETVGSYNLSSSSEPILVDTPPSEEGDFRLQTLLSQAVPADVDLVVAAVFRVLSTEVDIQFILVDPKEKTVLGGVLSRARTGLTVFTSVDNAVNDLDPVLEQYVKNRYQYRPPEGVVDQITLSSTLEGEEVFFAGRDVGRIAAGMLRVPYTPFPVGSKVRAEIRKSGYHPEEVVISLPAAKVEAKVPALERYSRFAGGVNWAFGESEGFGLSARYYAVPDWTYVELGGYRHLIPEGGLVLRDIRNFDFGASVGQYLFLSYRSPIRVSVLLGVGIIYTSVAGFSGSHFSDVYLNLGSPSIEANLSGWHFFIQPQLKFALGLGDNLLQRSWIFTSLGLPPITVGAFRTW